ncbi:MAG: hypothetical protein PHR28_07515 [candidate division Zixibacteria bacterium]|nr:hypothetical protein [candidate division Zixibacteria bacterium]
MDTTILDELIRLAEKLGVSNGASVSTELFDLTRSPKPVAPTEEPATHCVSRLNGDGTPLQVVVSAGSAGCGLGFIVDPVEAGATVSTRVFETGRVLARICAADTAEATVILEHYRRVSSVLLPQEVSELDGLDGGGVWVAVRLMPAGGTYVSAYFNGAWGDDTHKAERQLRLLSDFSCPRARRRLVSLQSFLASFSKPLGQAVSIGGTRNGIAKFYFRTFDPSLRNIAELYAGVGMKSGYADFEAFTEAILPPFPAYPDPAIVFSLEFDLDADRLHGLKVDACAHCLPHGDDSYVTRWTALMRRFGFDTEDYHRAIRIVAKGDITSDALCHAFMGVGHDLDGGRRLNAYLKPTGCGK